MDNYPGHDYWIGVSDRRSEGNYSFNSDIDDVSVDLGTWRVNEPSGVGQECVVMDNYPGHWYDRTCSTDYASICEIDGINQIEDTETVIEADPNPSSIEDWDCPVSTNDTSYRLIDGACLYFESIKMNYGFAENNCLDKFGPSGRGRLLEPQSLRQNIKIYKVADQEVLGTGSNLPYWIGVSDIRNEGTYSYNSQPGNNSVTLEAWASNEPSGSTTDNCIAMDDFPGKWWDRRCNTDYASICEVGSKNNNQDDVSSQDASSNDSPKSLSSNSDWS